MSALAAGGPYLALALVALAYAWPLVRQLTTAMPGGPADLDVATMVWNLGWVAHALSGGDARSLLHSADVLAPFGADLRLHTYGLFEGLLAAPLVPLLGVQGAFNVMLVLTLWLNGAALYVLARLECGSRLAALVGAVCFMLASPLLDQIRVGRPTFAALWITVLAVLVVRQMCRAVRWWHVPALAGLLVATLFTDFQIVLYSALWLAIYAVAHVRTRQVVPLLAAGLIAAIPFLLLFYPALAADDYPRPTLADMREYSFRVWDLTDPEVAPHLVSLELALAALWALVTRRHLTWLIGGLVCLMLSLGPYLQPTTLPLPFAALSSWPPLAQFRTPYRLAIPAAFGFALVLSLVLAGLFQRWRASIRIALAGGLIAARLAFALAHDPFETQTYPSYATYARIASEPGRFTILEVPFGVRSGLERVGDGGEVLEYYQHIHGKPLLNAMVARLPRGVFETYRDIPALRLLSGESVSASSADLQALLDWTDARYVLVHRDRLSADADRTDRQLPGHAHPDAASQ